MRSSCLANCLIVALPCAPENASSIVCEKGMLPMSKVSLTKTLHLQIASASLTKSVNSAFSKSAYAWISMSPIVSP